jgi:hypothetical protein
MGSQVYGFEGKALQFLLQSALTWSESPTLVYFLSTLSYPGEVNDLFKFQILLSSSYIAELCKLTGVINNLRQWS